MAETPQLYRGFKAESSKTETGFNAPINSLIDTASNSYLVGNEFERLIKRNLRVAPVYNEPVNNVYLRKP